MINREFANSRIVVFLLLIAFISIYLLYFKIPPPWTDDCILKEPAFTLSKGLGFAAPSVTGYRLGIEKLFLHYPPFYMIFFAGWFKIFGFSIVTSMAVSFLMVGISAYLLVKLFETILGYSLPKIGYGLVFVCWRLAISDFSICRPDSLLILLLLVLLNILYRIKPIKMDRFFLAIAIFMSLCLLTSPVLGPLFLFVYVFFCYVSILENTRKSVLFFVMIGSLSGVLALVFWSPFCLMKFAYFKSQFLDSFSNDSSLIVSLESVVNALRFNFHHGMLLQNVTLPCMLMALALPFYLNVISDSKKRKEVLPLTALIAIWVFLIVDVQTKFPYLSVCDFFLVQVLGVAFIKYRGAITDFKLKGVMNAVLLAGIIYASSPIITVMAIPLTWVKSDTYQYNARRILQQIPKGSLVLGDVKFWYMLMADYRFRDGFFTPSSIYDSEYVLLDKKEFRPSNMSEEKKQELKSYFDNNFILIDSTALDEPNRLWGVTISQSRLSYRFSLYRRKTLLIK